MPDFVQTAYTVETKPGASWVVLDSGLVEEVSGLAELSGSREGALSPGDNSALEVDVQLHADAFTAVPPDRLPMRITYSVGNTTAKACVGHLRRAEQATIEAIWNLRVTGIRDHLSKVRLASPGFEGIPLARKTTASSPITPNTTGISPMEWAALSAGGWPASRDFENSNALFYYDFDHALIAPDRSWFAGEDTWQEMQNFAKASLGALYQGQDGVLYYRSLLGFGDTSPLVSFDESVYEDLSFAVSTDRVATKLQGTWVERRGYAMQEVLKDTQMRVLRANSATTIELQLDQPLDAIQAATGIAEIRPGQSLSAQLPADGLLVIDGSSNRIQSGSGFTYTLSLTAQRLTFIITNTRSYDLYLYEIVINGQPVKTGATGFIEVGSGTTTQTVDESPYIQRRSDCVAVTTLGLSYLQSSRPTYTAKHCIYNPNVKLCDTVALSSTRRNLANVRCLVAAIRHEGTGLYADYDLIYVEDLPKRSDFYEVGTTNWTTAKRLAP